MRRIKSFLCLVGLVLLSHQSALAQNELVFGIRGGVNISEVTGNLVDEYPELDYSTLTGFNGGAFARIYVTPSLSVQMEGSLSQKGSTVSADGETADLKLTYIEWPLFLRYEIVAGSLRPAAYIGSSIAFETSCEVKGPGGTFDCDEGGLESTKSLDAGFILGLGLDIRLGRVILMGDGRYTIGYRNLNDSTDSSSDFKNRNWSFLFGVGVPMDI